MNPDISLPQLSVLGSKMAYRQMGRSGAPVALFYLTRLRRVKPNRPVGKLIGCFD